MSYVIMRPGGMERPKDDYKLTHALTVKPRDSTFGGQVMQDNRPCVAPWGGGTATTPWLTSLTHSLPIDSCTRPFA
jgi:hypothetical protein